MKKSFEIACLFALIGCSSEMPPELPEENRDTDIIFTATENTSKKVTTSRASTVASRFMNRPVSKANCCNVETVLDDNGVPLILMKEASSLFQQALIITRFWQVPKPVFST